MRAQRLQLGRKRRARAAHASIVWAAARSAILHQPRARGHSASAPIAAMNCVPLISARPSLAPSSSGCRPAARSASAAGQHLAADLREALADQHQREVRQRSQVAAGAQRAARGHHRVHAGSQQVEQQLHRLEPHARAALGERVGAQQRGRPHDLDGERIADPAGVAAQQVQLQLGRLLRLDVDIHEPPEPGVDAIGRPPRPPPARSGRAMRRSAWGGRLLPWAAARGRSYPAC